VAPSKIEEVIRLYQAGRSVDWIAERLDVSSSTVRRTLVRAGVPIRPRGRPRRSAS
jgi:DNA-binding NarL/FixJ family response regulator